MRLCTILLFVFGLRLLAGEVIPPTPTAYFNDYAHVVSPATALQLDQTLEDFERQSSNQIFVAIFSKLQSDSPIGDYTLRVARDWGMGQTNKNNAAAVLFVFLQDHQTFLQAGNELEGTFSNTPYQRLINEQIGPRVRAGDYDGGLTAGVHAMLVAAQKKHHGRITVGDRRRAESDYLIVFLVGLLFVVGVTQHGFSREGGFYYGGSGWFRGYAGSWNSGLSGDWSRFGGGGSSGSRSRGGKESRGASGNEGFDGGGAGGKW